MGRASTHGPFFFIAALASSPPRLFSQQTPLTVLTRDSTPRAADLQTTTVNEQEYVALDDLASMFQLTLREDAGG